MTPVPSVGRDASRRVRRFVIWMYAPDTPHWSMPSFSLRRISAALGTDWKVESVEIPLEATGDGVRSAPTELLDAVREAEVYCGWGMRRNIFLAAKRLRWFHSGAAGVRNSLFGEMRESDVIFTNSAGIYGGALADHALAGIFYFARGLDVSVRAQRECRWVQGELNSPDSPLHGPPARGEVAGASLGILGYGGIGSELGKRAAALGMRVRAIRRVPGRETPPELEWLKGPDCLAELLECSDYVAVTLPETADTRALLGTKELALMRPGAVLINLARGTVIDETALVRALESGRLGGAMLDVFQREPLPADHPLWKLENVLLTPHTGGTSAYFWERETELIVRNIGLYLAGRPLENRVDKGRGY